MAELQEIIARLQPQATFEPGDTLTVCIPDAQWPDFARQLRDNEELRFDFLVTIVGMDWKEKVGCIYYLTSTTHCRHLAVKVTTDNVEKPMLHSVADLWHIAGIFEREVYDFFGIVFIGNPDMRRLFLSIDWNGHPLRKNYDENPELNPVTTDSERQSDFTDTYVETADGTVEKKEVRVFEPEDFVVNIGPQHPATHGVLRFRTAIDGETINKIDVYMGYISTAASKKYARSSLILRHFISWTDWITSRPIPITTVCACSSRRPPVSRYRAVHR